MCFTRLLFTACIRISSNLTMAENAGLYHLLISKGKIMASVLAVAKFILERTGEVSAMKLQKLVYYSQAWHMVWEDKPLFDDDFQAWANGPVQPALYAKHRGLFIVDKSILGEVTDEVEGSAAQNIEKVLSFYGEKSGHWLSNLTHSERPWVEARNGTAMGERSEAVISKASIAEYYGSL